MVIFGGGGDLTKRLVVPALYNLGCNHLLPKQFAIVGVDLAQHTTEDWTKDLRAMAEEFVKTSGQERSLNEDVWKSLTANMCYMQGDLNDDGTYHKLKDLLSETDAQKGTGGNYLFYLAIADRFFATVVQKLGQSSLASQNNSHWRRVVIEKPFGHDLSSAQALRAAGVGTLTVSPMAFTGPERIEQLRAVAELAA